MTPVKVWIQHCSTCTETLTGSWTVIWDKIDKLTQDRALPSIDVLLNQTTGWAPTWSVNIWHIMRVSLNHHCAAGQNIFETNPLKKITMQFIKLHPIQTGMQIYSWQKHAKHLAVPRDPIFSKIFAWLGNMPQSTHLKQSFPCHLQLWCNSWARHLIYNKLKHHWVWNITGLTDGVLSPHTLTIHKHCLIATLCNNLRHHSTLSLINFL